MALVTADQVRNGRGDEVALADGERELTWSALDDVLNRATNALLSMVERDDPDGHRRIAVFARNSVEVVAVHFAAHLAGVSSVPTSSLLGVDELAYILGDSKATCVFAGPDTAKVAIAAAKQAGVARVVLWRTPDHAGGEGLRVTAWDQWLAGAPSDEPTTWQAPRYALLYTSGTTGRPKGTQIRVQPSLRDTVGEWIPALGEGIAAAGLPHLVVGPLHHTGPFVVMRTSRPARR